MTCSDALVLQRLLDGDLDDSQAEIVEHHLESCASCRAEAVRIARLRAFVQDQLGFEDEGEDELTAATLAGIRSRLSAVRAPRRRRWRLRSLAAMLTIALLLPMPFVSILDAWAEDILQEAVVRERSWMCQPNRVLHWQVDTVSSGIQGVADGRWRTLFWRKNGERTYSEISRQVMADGSVDNAFWKYADGSSINYRAKRGTIEIAPSTAALREAASAVPPELRRALQGHLTQRTLGRSLDVKSRADAESLHGRFAWTTADTVTFRTGVLGAVGEIRRITAIKDHPETNPLIARVVHEYDVESSTLRFLRLRTTITYTDGTTGTHDSRWVIFRETSDAEFDAQTPRQLLDSALPVVRLTPHELARRYKQEMDAAVTQ